MIFHFIRSIDLNRIVEFTQIFPSLNLSMLAKMQFRLDSNKIEYRRTEYLAGNVIIRLGLTFLNVDCDIFCANILTLLISLRTQRKDNKNVW